MEESLKHSSQLDHDLGWPPHDPKNRDRLEVEGVLDREVSGTQLRHAISARSNFGTRVFPDTHSS